MKPDPTNYNPDPDYLRDLIDKAGLSQRGAARALRYSERSMRHYLAGRGECPYILQFCLEVLADLNQPVKDEVKQ